MNRIHLFFLCFVFFSFLSSQPAAALEASRTVTVVYPVRSSSHWRIPDALHSQMIVSRAFNLPVTWLLSYPVLLDREARSQLDGHLPADEVGLWLEVDDRVAQDSLVPYLFGEGDWARADKVLLSGYQPSERARMIDRLFDSFKKAFGTYPSSVGAWYVDPYSLSYMAQKYGVTATLIVADQYQTDTYGVWGQPWGTPYVPSRFHSLIPGKSEKQLPVLFQWAVRDPVRGFGTTVSDSTWSVQANDYSGHGMGVEYFQSLLASYLFSPNELSQVTVGIEVGQEGESFKKEYAKQVETVKELHNSGKAVQRTMKDAAAEYQKNRKKADAGFFVTAIDPQDTTKTAYWFSTPFYRIGLLKANGTLSLRDLRIYSRQVSPDVFRKDTSPVLHRIVPSLTDDALDNNARVLVSGVSDISAARDQEGIRISVAAKDGSHMLRLLPDDAVWDGETLLPKRPVIHAGSVVSGWQDAVLADHLGSFHGWLGGFRFSTIDGIRYAGIWTSPSTLAGVRTSLPPGGVFSFPFQTLARFRALPPENMRDLLSDYLVNGGKLSTIRK